MSAGDEATAAARNKIAVSDEAGGAQLECCGGLNNVDYSKVQRQRTTIKCERVPDFNVSQRKCPAKGADPGGDESLIPPVGVSPQPAELLRDTNIRL